MNEAGNNIAVTLEKHNGTYRAAVVGIPSIHAEASTADQATRAVAEQLNTRLASGQLVFVNVGLVGISGLIGKYKDDPILREICDEAYRQRDAERDAEHGGIEVERGTAKRVTGRKPPTTSKGQQRRPPKKWANN